MPFLPENFVVPRLLETARVRLRPLVVADVVKDYEAVMSSRTNLWRLFGAAWGWPAETLTLEDDCRQLAWHEKEFETRSSFDYVVMSLDESQVLGCVYVDPPTKQGFEAEVYFWVRDSELPTGLEGHLSDTVRQWITTSWPLARVAYPGRDIPWSDWDALPER